MKLTTNNDKIYLGDIMKKLFVFFMFLVIFSACSKVKLSLTTNEIDHDLGTVFNELDYIKRVEQDKYDDVTISSNVDINVVGQYEVVYKYGEIEEKLIVHVKDITAPIVVVHDLTIPVGKIITAEMFIDEITDATNVTYCIKNKVDTTIVGIHDIELVFTDAGDNVTTKRVNLIIEADTTGPVITGASIKTVNVGASVDLLSGYLAVDDADGDVTSSLVTSISKLDTSKVGEIKVVYTAKDRAGNSTSMTVVYKIITNDDRSTMAVNTDGLSNKADSWPHSKPLSLANQFAAKGAYYVGDTTSKTYYLTFDVGYENGYTLQILDILKANGVQATFFLTKDYLVRYPDIVTRMINEGHFIGNHTMYHPSLPSISNAKIVEELLGFEKYFNDKFGGIYNNKLKYFRPPNGDWSDRTLSVTKQLGYKTIMWNFTFRDWDMSKIPTVQDVRDAFHRELTQDGTILLLHGVCPTYPDILDEILKEYIDKGYAFKSLDEMELILE